MALAKAEEDEDTQFRNALCQSALDHSKAGLQDCLRLEPLSLEMESVLLYQSIELGRLSEPDADILVFIGAPPQQADQTTEAYACIAAHFANNHRIHSKNVLGLGSEKLENLLAPTSQFRTERRLRNQGILPGGKPSGIKYLLDLRPPIEEDEAIVLITELSCPSGTLTWSKAQKKYEISGTMLCGQDDMTLLPKVSISAISSGNRRKPWKKKLHTIRQPLADQPPSEPRVGDASDQDNASNLRRHGNWAGMLPTVPVIPDEAINDEAESGPTTNTEIDKEPSESDTDSEIDKPSEEQAQAQPEYSQLRHWSAIERLLHAIVGNDPMLDSAPKLWTFFSVAKFFGCASNERISGWVTKWLFTAPNHNFIQCNPEICYRIGLGIQSEPLLKDAFSLLVGEKALINVHHELSAVRSLNIQTSVAGRKLELLDDDDINRIDHAANSFIKRIQSTYEAVIGQDMHWLEQSAVYRILAKFVAHSNREKQIAQQLKEQIKTFVRSRVLWVLARDYEGDMSEMEQVPESVRPFYPHASSQFSKYNRLSQEERIFTRFFWLALRGEYFDVGHNAVFTVPLAQNRLSLQGVPSPGWSKLATELQEGSTKTKLIGIEKGELCASAAKFMKILNERYRNGHSREKNHGNYLDGSLHPQGKLANSKPTASQSRMSEYGVLPEEEIEFDNPTANSTMQHFENLHLSSPKRARTIDLAAQTAEQKRARLDFDDMFGRSNQMKSNHAELPIRVAAHQFVSSLMPEKQQRLMKVVQWQAGEAEAPRSAYVQTEVPVDDSRPAFDSRTDPAHASFKERAEVRVVKEKRRERCNKPDCCNEHSFSIEKLLDEVSQAIRGFCDEVLLAPHFIRDNGVPPTDLIDSLMSLGDEEWKYLPLWAGGCDDGSGGVFNDLEPPILEAGGFDGGTRGLGGSGESSTAGSSSWSEIISTVGKASREAIDGTATETATVRSLGDVDMDVRSLDEESSMREVETETAENMGFSSADDLDGDDDDDGENQESNDDDMEDDDVGLEEDCEDLEEPEWDDCGM